MGPSRTQKIGVAAENSSDESILPQRNVMLQSPMRTPIQSPVKKPMMITEAQKQALIDNLQLEVTERARKLRAQCALQAQSLRTRLELRINRIPTSLRKASMGELYEKSQVTAKESAPEAAATSTEAPKSLKESAQPEKPLSPVKALENQAAPRVGGVKRTRYGTTQESNKNGSQSTLSDHLEHADKENTPEPGHLPNPKKRTKTTAISPSRQLTNPSTVLSPKSSNSRTLPQSPIRPALASPQKSYLSRPPSPLKPMSPSKQLPPSKQFSPAKSAAIAAISTLANTASEKPKATRGKAAAGKKATITAATAAKPAATRAKRGVGASQAARGTRIASNSSDASTTSNATTVMRKGGKAPASAASAARKRGVGVSAAGKKVAEAPAAGRRILRKRA